MCLPSDARGVGGHLRRAARIAAKAWPGASDRCPVYVYTRRMPRMQVYLPDDLYAVVKERQLPASELLQDAVRKEIRRLALQAASERDTDILAAQIGEPSAQVRGRAVALARRVAARMNRKAG